MLSLCESLANLASERSLRPVLQRVSDLAREILGARYAALGVANDEGRLLDFYTSGISAEQRAAIGPLPRGHGLLGVLIREGRPIRVPDIGHDPRSSGFPPNHPPMRSLMGVPIVSNGRVVGDLYVCDRVDERPFDDEDERLALLLAHHAAIAIENAGANDELERRLAQLSRIREFGVAVSSQLDVERTLQVAAERAAELLDASLVAIALLDVDGGTLTVEAAAGRRARRVLGARIPVASSLAGEVIRGRRVEIVGDVARDERVSLQILELTGGRTGLWSPLVVGPRAIGCIIALDPLNHATFGEADASIAETIGQRAGLAIENARLYERAKQEASTSGALLSITRAMNASVRLEEILQLIVDSLSELIGAPSIAVYLLSDDGRELELAAGRALASDGEPPPAAAALATLAFGQSGPLVVADALSRADLPLPRLRGGARPRSAVFAPIRLAERSLGLIAAFSTEPSHFSQDEIDLLGAFADQAATAIENTRLYRQARELALLQERDRIARDLHDGIIQTIYAVGLNIEYCRMALVEEPNEVESRLTNAVAQLNSAIDEIRRYILDLTHRARADSDLIESVMTLAHQISTARPDAPRVRVDIRPEVAAAVPADRVASLAQLLREAMSNASRHASARAVDVYARAQDGVLVFGVEDDGRGFTLSGASSRGHHGLRNMHERAVALGGQLDVRSAPGEGTTVELRLPAAIRPT